MAIMEQKNYEIMKIKKGRLMECFAFIPSLELSWVRTHIGHIYILRLAWLYWYIEIRKFPNKYGKIN